MTVDEFTQVLVRLTVRTQYNAPMCYGIIADDLSGSCDAAARAVRSGYQPLVALKLGVFGRLSWKRLTHRKGAMVVVNTRSRDGNLQLATARARTAAATLERNGLPVVYQKIDSTLRGHRPEELKAIVEVIQPDWVLVCPAFPGQGRFVRHGQLGIRQPRGRRITHPPGNAARDLGKILQSRSG